MKKKLSTFAEAVQQVLAEVDGPIKLNAFIENVLGIRPSSAKKSSASASIRNHLRTNEEGKSLVYLDLVDSGSWFAEGKLAASERLS